MLGGKDIFKKEKQIVKIKFLNMVINQEQNKENLTIKPDNHQLEYLNKNIVNKAMLQRLLKRLKQLKTGKCSQSVTSKTHQVRY